MTERVAGNDRHQRAAPWLKRRQKLRIRLPPAESRQNNGRISCVKAVREPIFQSELRVEPWSLLCFILFLQGGAFIF